MKNIMSYVNPTEKKLLTPFNQFCQSLEIQKAKQEIKPRTTNLMAAQDEAAARFDIIMPIRHEKHKFYDLDLMGKK